MPEAGRVGMTDPPRATTFFNRTFEEALALAEEARDYLAFEQTAARRALALPARLQLSEETFRLTARLTHMMAWLLARKAVFAGEMSERAAVATDAVLSDQGVCLAPGGEGADALPPRFRALLERSRRLYVRVARLDDMVRRQLA